MSNATEVTTTLSSITAIIGEDTVNTIGQFVEASNKKERSGVRLLDVLRAAEYKADYMTAPKGEAKEEVIHVNGANHTRLEVHTATKKAVVLGFSQTIQALLDTPTTALSQVKKDDKKYWQQQIGSRMSDFKRLLTKSEADADGGTPNTKKDLLTQLTELVNNAKGKAQKAEKPEFDVTAFVKAMDSGLAALTKKA